MSPTAPADAGGRSFVDLHLHSTASDGILPAREVVAAAKAASLAAIALTDHDTVAGIAEAAQAGAALGVEVIPGVELSATDGERETHLLGLHLHSLESIDAALAGFRDARFRRALRIVEKLNALGVPMRFDSVLEHSGSGAVGRPHIARALIAGGWASDMKNAFDLYLGAGRSAFVPKEKLSLRDAIALIHKAGGIAIFAHPGAEGNLETITRMRREGLDGVEVLHPSHGSEDVARIGAIVEHLRCLRSGGSDWHGVDSARRILGGQKVPAQWLEEQRRAAEERRTRD